MEGQKDKIHPTGSQKGKNGLKWPKSALFFWNKGQMRVTCPMCASFFLSQICWTNFVPIISHLSLSLVQIMPESHEGCTYNLHQPSARNFSRGHILIILSEDFQRFYILPPSYYWGLPTSHCFCTNSLKEPNVWNQIMFKIKLNICRRELYRKYINCPAL